ncbi:MAG: indole-3-glycerol phosphate synthase TrpC, partial [Chloroflexota bacterium]|nr:indole-3-glycerol phosphate synthase TrpC [Chloroflexota bacterium]
MILQQILEHKTSEVEERAATFPLAEIQARAKAASPARVPDFSATMSLIAEVKRRSPSQGDIVSAFDPVAQARACQAGGASAISVLTDSRFFGGCFDDLSAVRQAVSVPILCKDFILTPYQLYEARAHGADLVLLIVAALDDAQLWEFQALARDLGMT